MIRVGHGFDFHRLAPGRPLVLGGVPIAHDQGPIAHSDGDVVLHALCDALLGAASLGDIGRYFPDTDPRFANSASSFFVKETMAMVKSCGFDLGNVDVTILAERPRLAPYIPAMRAALSPLLGLPEETISIKAKTMEGAGEIGDGKAIAAHAVCLLFLPGKEMLDRAALL